MNDETNKHVENCIVIMPIFCGGLLFFEFVGYVFEVYWIDFIDLICIDFVIIKFIFWIMVFLDKYTNRKYYDRVRYYSSSVKTYNKFSIVMVWCSVGWLIFWAIISHGFGGFEFGIGGFFLGLSLVVSIRIWVHHLNKELEIAKIVKEQEDEQRRLDEKREAEERQIKEEQEAERQRLTEEQKAQQEERKRQNEERIKQLRANLEEIQQKRKE